MSLKLLIRSAAKRDLAEAALWYDKRRRGLGLDFLAAVRERLNVVVEAPFVFQVKIEPDLRSALVQRFPYLIFFVATETHVAVLAVLHTSQDHRRHLRRRRRD